MSDGSSSKSFVRLNAELDINGRGLTNGFVSDFATGGELTRDSRLSQLEKLGPENEVGGDYDLGLSAGIHLGKGLTALVKLSDRWHIDASFPKDAFELTFFGNQTFAGDTAQLSGFTLNQYRFQEFALGIAWQASPTYGFYGMASLYKGELMQELELNEAWLYTSSLGDTLQAAASGSFFQSDTNNVGFGAANGWGAGLTFGAHAKLSGKQSDWLIAAQVKDLGWISWNDQNLKYKTDTLSRWTGVQIDDVNGLTDNSLDGVDSDSLIESALGDVGRGRHATMLPGWIQLDIRQLRDRGWINAGGLSVRWKARFSPYAWFASGYQFSSAWSAMASLGYGGYGRGRAGVSVRYVKDFLVAGIEIHNLEAYLVPNQLVGAGIHLNVAYLF